MPMAFEGSKRRSLFFSMLILAGLIGGAVLATSAFTTYFRSQDPVNQCVDDPESQPFQLSVPITVIEVAYSRPYDFTLGHFLYYWLGNDLLQYDTKVYVNDTLHIEGDLRDIVLEEENRIRIEFVSRN